MDVTHQDYLGQAKLNYSLSSLPVWYFKNLKSFIFHCLPHDYYYESHTEQPIQSMILLYW